MQDTEYAVRSATVWHRPFYDLLAEGAPSSIEVRTEILLSEPHRADLLLLRRKDVPPRNDEARVLRGLWPLLGPVTLAQFEGPSSTFHPGALLRLVRYGLQYHELNTETLPGPSALTLALFMPAPTPTLRASIEHMESWRLEPLGNGYARIVGACYTILVAFLDEVCEAERDDYLRLFSHHRQQSREAVRWLTARFLEMPSMYNAEYRQSHDALLKRLLEVLPPEEVMQDFTPEARQAGIRPADDSRHCAALAFEDQRGAVRALSPEDRAALCKLLDESS